MLAALAPRPTLQIESNFGTIAGATALWWNKDGVRKCTSPDWWAIVRHPNWWFDHALVVVQVDNVTSVSTFTASEWCAPGQDTCHFTAQAVTTNG